MLKIEMSDNGYLWYAKEGSKIIKVYHTEKEALCYIEGFDNKQEQSKKIEASGAF